MNQPDFERAKQYVLGRLEKELPPDLYYHGIHHTRDDVLPAVERLARLEKLPAEETLLLRTAALYHDTGYMEDYYNNEEIGLRIAHETLPYFGYQPADIEVVGQIIMVTRLPQCPQNLMEQIICDADMDSLGRKDFFITSHRLRLELTIYDVPVSLRDWYPRQLEFLEAHRYWTAGAHHLRETGKQNNVNEIKQLLAR
jgi:uncharacterized protein